MNNKYLSLAVVATGVVATGFVMLTQVNAAQWANYGPNHTEAREIQMDSIFTNKDFTAWKKLMSEDNNNSGALRKIDTQAEFDKFVEAQQLREQGKTAEATTIRSQLGLGAGMGQGGNGSSGKGTGNGANKGSNNQGNFADVNKDGVCDNQ